MKPSDEIDPTLTPAEARALSDTVVQGDAEPAGKVRVEPTGYELGVLLGSGGMGEVLLARDLRIDREVAVKRMRAQAPSADAVARFLREAKIQARLDHPAIVPVHELGTDADGRPYFTMKRLAGTTLADVLEAGVLPARRLLRVVVEVCQAIEFAHARNVIHRDLKPSNVMLGEYGEVYVLDWGVARVGGDRELTGGDIPSLDGQTQVGAVLGTPGYMSPEQVRGEAVTPATDVYALGAILFEVLTGKPAHPRGQAALVTTLEAAPSPAVRAPDRAIPPELDAACVAALAGEPADRPTAGALADRIQRYLDGDRDLEARRTLAGEEVARARDAFATGDPSRRADAMRAAGRALALDPDSADATKLVLQVMLEPPKQLPGKLVDRLAQIDDELVGKQARLASRTMLAYLLIVPLVVLVGVREWWAVIATFALAVLNIIGAEIMHRRRQHPIYWALITNSLMLIVLSRYASPFVLLPGVALATAISLVVFPTLLARPWLVIGPFTAAYLVPFALEAAGVWTSTWHLAGGEIVIDSQALRVDTAAIGFLILVNIVTLVVVPLFVRSLALAQRDGRRQLEIQAWHLGQLLPVETPRLSVPESRCGL